MATVLICHTCATEFEARTSVQRCCSPKCKREFKKNYDRERYPSVQAATIERACAWQRENKSRKRSYDAEYRERTRDRRLALKREHGCTTYWSDVDAARLRAQENEHRRRARLLGNGTFEVSPRDRSRLLARYGHGCAYCGSKFSPTVGLEWDHVLPVVRGGGHGIGNLLPACHDCNRSKSHRTVMEWRTRKVVTRPSQIG